MNMPLNVEDAVKAIREYKGEYFPVYYFEKARNIDNAEYYITIGHHNIEFNLTKTICDSWIIHPDTEEYCGNCFFPAIMVLEPLVADTVFTKIKVAPLYGMYFLSEKEAVAMAEYLEEHYPYYVNKE